MKPPHDVLCHSHSDRHMCLCSFLPPGIALKCPKIGNHMAFLLQGGGPAGQKSFCLFLKLLMYGFHKSCHNSHFKWQYLVFYHVRCKLQSPLDQAPVVGTLRTRFPQPHRYPEVSQHLLRWALTAALPASAWPDMVCNTKSQHQSWRKSYSPIW